MTGGTGRDGIWGSMNVPPLIDVLLNLLVIFMIISPITPRGENALIPQPPAKHEKPQPNNRSVVLQVLAGPGQPELKINQQDVSWPDLTNRLVTIYETRAERALFIKLE